MDRTKILSFMWKDTMDIYRTVEAKDEWNEIIQTEKIIRNGIKCKLSNKILRAPEEGNNPTSINQYKIFTYPTIDVKQNDIVVLTRAGIVHKFKITKPFIYPLSHLEIVVDEVIDGGA